MFVIKWFVPKQSALSSHAGTVQTAIKALCHPAVAATATVVPLQVFVVVTD